MIVLINTLLQSGRVSIPYWNDAHLIQRQYIQTIVRSRLIPRLMPCNIAIGKGIFKRIVQKRFTLDTQYIPIMTVNHHIHTTRLTWTFFIKITSTFNMTYKPLYSQLSIHVYFFHTKHDSVYSHATRSTPDSP